MVIHIIAVGQRMPSWVQAGYEEYAKRLPAHCRLSMRELPAMRRTKGADLARLIAQEGERLRAATPAPCRVIALDRAGQSLSTAALAERMRQWMRDAVEPAFWIGGPEGLDAATLRAAAERWSLSDLTLAHPVVRVVLAEQLYRAWSIIGNQPYHR